MEVMLRGEMTNAEYRKLEAIKPIAIDLQGIRFTAEDCIVDGDGIEVYKVANGFVVWTPGKLRFRATKAGALNLWR